MAIKRYQIFSKLLILVVVVYTLILSKDTTFAQKSNDTESRAFVEVAAHVDKNEVTIGDKIKFGIQVKYKGDITIQFPEVGEQIGVFTIKETGLAGTPEREKDGYLVVEREYVLSSYEIGRQTVPSLKIKYKGRQGDGEVATNEVTVDIKGVLKEGEISGDIKDILPPVDVPTSFKRLIVWISVGLGALLLSGVIYGLVYKLKKRSKIREQQFIRRTPQEIAYGLLERLSKEDLIGKGLVKEYYYRITNILRHYIEDRFGLLAPERTTEEFLTEMAHTNKLDDIHKILIREFLERCDMVKYAKYGPSNFEIKETYDAAKRFIDETIERLEEKEVVAAKK
ncbi:MAG: hypothetical protein Q7J76_00270 [Candidatus Brocadiaceae bacterium]|uniref:hypothetical protein n=1 Tax=Candidatus Wunengus sp. YC61 TaxID=3367698 RepID=UPI00271C192C|nr:hypothetical protein [Candidatus Brocadiaceae bacterium]